MLVLSCSRMGPAVESFRYEETQKPSTIPTYKTNSAAEIHGGRRNFIKDLDHILEQCDKLIVASSEITEGLCLLLNSLSDGLDGVAALEFVGEWTLDEIDIRLLFILLQSGLK